LEDREAQPYAAIRKQVAAPFGSVLGELWGEVFSWLSARGTSPSGAPFIRYLFIDMPSRLDLEVGVKVAAALEGNERIATGSLPAGTYAVAIHTGHYDKLEESTARFLEWGQKNGIQWQKTNADPGEHWVSRVESYLNDPTDEPNP
jgi:effector-binding domain-containing protein